MTGRLRQQIGADRRSMPTTHSAVRHPLQPAGQDAGLKLTEIKRLREKGHRITLLNETQFWRLVKRRS